MGHFSFKRFATLVTVFFCLALSPYVSAEGLSNDAWDAPRIMALGFDDFRESDFDMVLPLLEAHGMAATFNRIHWGTRLLMNPDMDRIARILHTGSEIGDHTWMHDNHLYSDPLFNGQDPASPEGDQIPYPANDDFRLDRGDGFNAFGFSIDSTVRDDLAPWNWDGRLPLPDTTWAALSDPECQDLRNAYAIYRDTTGLLDMLDALSHRYLHTSGASRGSWSTQKGCYTGGIFTGCRTSANHEIWERVLEVTARFYIDHGDKIQFFYTENMHLTFSTWSWPGPLMCPFVYRDGDKAFYDPEHTVPYNYLARFPSTTRTDARGEPLERSWTEALRSSGYKMTHDTLYPSRADGLETPMMRRQLYLNASLSRRDALAYPTDRTVDYSAIAVEYPSEFFDETSIQSAAEQMYDLGGEFYRFIEALRSDVAQGLVHGETIDSMDTFSERCFLEEALRFCEYSGIQVISKKVAYDICFGPLLDEGNLILNPAFRNTAREYLPGAQSVPAYPDGYSGDCSTALQGEKPALLVSGQAQYLRYGVPLGDLLFSFDALGEGSVSLYAVRNRDSIELSLPELSLLAQVPVNADTAQPYRAAFRIEDAPEGAYEPVCEGLGDKVMALLIVYSGALTVSEVSLTRTY